MTTKNQMYDYAGYNVRFSVGGEAGGAASTQYAKFAAWTTMVAYSVQFTVTVVGTAGISTWAALKINTSGTTTVALTSLSTGTVGLGYNFLLSTASGGLSLAQGDILSVVFDYEAAS